MAQFDSDIRVEFLVTVQHASGSLYLPQTEWINTGLYERIILLVGVTGQSSQVELFIRQSQSQDGSNAKYLTDYNGGMILGTLPWPGASAQFGTVELVPSKLDLGGYRYIQLIVGFSLPLWATVAALLYPKDLPASQPAEYAEAVMMAG